MRELLAFGSGKQTGNEFVANKVNTNHTASNQRTLIDNTEVKRSESKLDVGDVVEAYQRAKHRLDKLTVSTLPLLD